MCLVTVLGRVRKTTWLWQHQLNLQKRHLQLDSKFFAVSEEVRDAVQENRPVVALETTIYTHGFSYPQNLELAYELEEAVRSSGGIPATVAVLDGVARVGLTKSELTSLIERAGPRKVSRRDLGFTTGLTLGGKLMNGGTTIAGTMILAHMAGIQVFSTGGLGGVHQGGELSMDISADLTELSRTPVAVICSGCKGFLDIPRTLQYLETQGVAVATFADGRAGPVDFPAFWSRDSGVKSPMVLKSETEAAAVIHAQLSLGMTSGFLFGNPIPDTGHGIPRPELDAIIKQALLLADEACASGSDNTPFVLRAIKELTGGRSVLSNRVLVEANVRRGTQVAIELCRLRTDSPTDQPRNKQTLSDSSKIAFPPSSRMPQQTIDNPSQADILVAGSLAIDLSCDYKPIGGSISQTKPQLQTSNPAVISQSVGGVGYNVAKAAHLVGATVRLFSAVGDDPSGTAAIRALQVDGMDTRAVRRIPHARTAQYVAVNDAKKDLIMAMADMSIFETTPTDREVLRSLLRDTRPKWFVTDANWEPVMMHRWLEEAGTTEGCRTAFEPVSTAKAQRLFDPSIRRKTWVYPQPVVDLATPNLLELASMHKAAHQAGLMEREDWWKVIDALGIPVSGASTELARATSHEMVELGIPQQCISLLPFIPCIACKLGPSGVLLAQLLHESDARLQDHDSRPFIISRTRTGSAGVGGLYLRLFPAVETVKDADIVSVNGAGDTFLGALLARSTQTHATVSNSVHFAQSASVMTLKSNQAVSPDLRSLARSASMYS